MQAQTQIPLPQPPPTLFGLLIQKIQFSNPVQFQLPEEIRNYYAGGGSREKRGYLAPADGRPSSSNITRWLVRRRQLVQGHADRVSRHLSQLLVSLP